MFQEEQEKQPVNLEQFLDAEYQEMERTHNRQKEVLNEIFEAWGEIFGAKRIKSNQSNEDENF